MNTPLRRSLLLIALVAPLLADCAGRRPLVMRYSMLPSGGSDTSRALNLAGEMAPGLDVRLVDLRRDTSSPWITSPGAPTSSGAEGALRWVTDAIRYELWNAGFGGGPAPATRLVVRGSIDTIDIGGFGLSGMSRRTAEVSLTLRVERDSAELMFGRYRGASIAASERDRSHEGAAVLLDMALSGALAKFVADVREKLK